jgi:hypothetical protein
MMAALHYVLGVSGLQNEGVGFGGYKRTSDQIVLQEFDYGKLTTRPVEKEGFIMGYGGALTLVNGSPFDWVLDSARSYQMSAWSWPTINAGNTFK